MSTQSKIEWTDATWNPVLGCDKVSAGCKNCYAIRTAYRLQHNPNPKVKAAFEGLTEMTGAGPNWTGRVNFVEDRLLEPCHWKKPRRVFVNSQSDLFHDGVSFEQIDRVFAVMGWAYQHTYQILTKRPERMLAYFTTRDSHLAMTRQFRNFVNYEKAVGPWPLPNVWLGVSCENQETADERIPLLLQTPAAVRWVSAEPLLGEISFRWFPAFGKPYPCQRKNSDSTDHLDGLREINWIVCGGESGPGARPMPEEWARTIMQQCKAAGVPFFMKQGAKANWPDFKNFDSFPADLQVREYPVSK